eukprot:Gb_22813 [translate_table: standard]
MDEVIFGCGYPVDIRGVREDSSWMVLDDQMKWNTFDEFKVQCLRLYMVGKARVLLDLGDMTLLSFVIDYIVLSVSRGRRSRCSLTPSSSASPWRHASTLGLASAPASVIFRWLSTCGASGRAPMINQLVQDV